MPHFSHWILTIIVILLTSFTSHATSWDQTPDAKTERVKLIHLIESISEQPLSHLPKVFDYIVASPYNFAALDAPEILILLRSTILHRLILDPNFKMSEDLYWRLVTLIAYIKNQSMSYHSYSTKGFVDDLVEQANATFIRLLNQKPSEHERMNLLENFLSLSDIQTKTGFRLSSSWRFSSFLSWISHLRGNEILFLSHSILPNHLAAPILIEEILRTESYNNMTPEQIHELFRLAAQRIKLISENELKSNRNLVSSLAHTFQSHYKKLMHLANFSPSTQETLDLFAKDILSFSKIKLVFMRLSRSSKSIESNTRIYYVGWDGARPEALTATENWIRQKNLDQKSTATSQAQAQPLISSSHSKKPVEIPDQKGQTHGSPSKSKLEVQSEGLEIQSSDRQRRLQISESGRLQILDHKGTVLTQHDGDYSLRTKGAYWVVSYFNHQFWYNKNTLLYETMTYDDPFVGKLHFLPAKHGENEASISCQQVTK